jgi:hypothetical protein
MDSISHSIIIMCLQIFQTMRRYGLGSEHAVKAMTVSDALARTIAESSGSVSILQAVTELTVRLSNAKFGQHQPEHEEVADGNGSVGVASATSSSSELDLAVVAPATPATAVTKKQAPNNLRTIKPVPSIERLAHAHTRSSSFSSTKAVAGGPGPNSSSSNTKKAKSSINKNGGKVKSKDGSISKDTQQQGETSNNRPRSDSVSDIVTAKLGAEKTAKQTDADKTVKNAPTGATPASVRAKRGRGEDSEVTASSHKRSRQSHKDV